MPGTRESAGRRAGLADGRFQYDFDPAEGLRRAAGKVLLGQHLADQAVSFVVLRCGVCGDGEVRLDSSFRRPRARFAAIGMAVPAGFAAASR